MRFDAHWLAARGEGRSSTCRPPPAVPPLVAGEPHGGRKRRLPLGFVRAAVYRTRPWVVGHRAASGIPSVCGARPDLEQSVKDNQK